MNTKQTFLLSAVVAFVAAFAASSLSLMLGKGSDSTASAEPVAREDATEERLATLDRTLKDLSQQVDSLRSQLDSGPRVSSGIPEEELDRLINEALIRRELALPVAVEATSGSEAASVNVSEVALSLMADGLSEEERRALWDKARLAGKEDELVAWFKEQAEANPENPDMQVDLANAYFQKLQSMPEGPAKGQVAMAADAVLDAALELDDHHWEARFTKAVALSFWPPVFGKQQEAINHFETLVGQQADQPAHEGFASTHLLLGNMYAQMGRTDEAIAAWQQGAEQFPDSAELQSQLEAYEPR